MPHLRIEANIALDGQAAMETAKKASAMCAAALGKPEQYVQVLVHGSAALVLGGTEAPAAYVELKSIGLSKDRCKDLSQALCGFLEAELSIPANRVYIEFAIIDGALFGWNNSTF